MQLLYGANIEFINNACYDETACVLHSHYFRAVRIMVYKGSHQTSPYTDDHNDDPNEDDDDGTWCY